MMHQGTQNNDEPLMSNQETSQSAMMNGYPNNNNSNPNNTNNPNHNPSFYTTPLKPPRIHPSNIYHNKNETNDNNDNNINDTITQYDDYNDNDDNAGLITHNYHIGHIDNDRNTDETVDKKEVEKRIRSYLRESDENCKESATLIAIVIIGLIVTGTVIGLLKIAHSDPHLNHKGSHAESIHTPYSLPWFNQHIESINEEIENNTLTINDIAIFQPLYRNILLQSLYDKSQKERVVISSSSSSDNIKSIFDYVSVVYGSWIPPREKNTTDELEVMEAPAVIPETVAIDGTPEIENNTQTQIQNNNGNVNVNSNPTTIRNERRQLLKNNRMTSHGLPIPRGYDKNSKDDTGNKKHGKRGGKHKKGDSTHQDSQMEAWKNLQNRLQNMLKSREEIVKSVSTEDYIDGTLSKLLFMTNYSNSDLFSFPQNYDGINAKYYNNQDLWQCYLVEFDSPDLVGQNNPNIMGQNGMFRISINFQGKPINLEAGYDYLKLFVNGEYITSYPSSYYNSFNDIFHNTPNKFIYYIDKNYISSFDFKNNDRASFELCYHIVTDDSIVDTGFEVKFDINYIDPNINHWENGNINDDECYILPANGRDKKRFDGSCGIGISIKDVNSCTNDDTTTDNNNQPPSKVTTQTPQTQTVTQTVTQTPQKQPPAHTVTQTQTQTQTVTQTTPQTQAATQTATQTQTQMQSVSSTSIELTIQIPSTSTINNNDGKRVLLDTSSNDMIHKCFKGEHVTQYCLKTTCENIDNTGKFDMTQHPNWAYHYNGIGRLDPLFPDPFKIERSTNIKFDIKKMISSLLQLKSSFEFKYLNEPRILSDALAPHSSMDDSKLRLGIKLARSLLLGDTFTVGFTGSSNTAGHDNLFMSSYPMQLQSLLRPIWKKIGYKGAAFVVKNSAIGGSLGTNQITWCLPQILNGGEDVDVVFWEEIMNDAGNKVAKQHTMENHIRTSISLPRRPVWHALVAGKQGNKPNKYDEFDSNGNIKKNSKNNRKLYDGWKNLIDYYKDFGSGIIEFNPSFGLNPYIAKFQNVTADKFYVTWHPGPNGHRLYAEQIGYLYLTAVIDVLTDIKEDVLKLQTNVPIEELLNLLEEPPRIGKLPKGKTCDPICIDASYSQNAKHQYCISGLRPIDSHNELSRYQVKDFGIGILNQTKNGWLYKSIGEHKQSITHMNGGQTSIDEKFGFIGNKNSGTLELKVKIMGHGFLLIEKPYSDWSSLKDVLKNMKDWFHVKVIGTYNKESDSMIVVPQLNKNNNVISPLNDPNVNINMSAIHNNKNIRRLLHKKKHDKFSGKGLDRYGIGSFIGGNDTTDNIDLQCIDDSHKLWNANLNDFGCVLYFGTPGKYIIQIKIDIDTDIPISVIASY